MLYNIIIMTNKNKENVLYVRGKVTHWAWGGGSEAGVWGDERRMCQSDHCAFWMTASFSWGWASPEKDDAPY